MNTRREFLFGFGAGLLLMAAGLPPAMGAAPASPVAAVRSYLAARARRDAPAQYALFSPQSRDQIPYAQFDTQFAGEKAPLAHAAEDGVSPVMAAVTMFFMDSHGTSGYRFSVAGLDPADPHTVLVRARPPGAAPGSVQIIRIATFSHAGDARLEMLESYQKTNPRDFDAMREHSKGIVSLSNLRQIGLALTMYTESHDGRFPPAGAWVDALMPQWANVKDRSFHAEELFRDPSAPGGEPFNYAFNRALSGMRLADLKDPSATVLVFESTAGVKNAADTGQTLPRPGRHAGGDYFIFADGRARWVADGAKLSYSPDGK